MYTTDNLCTSTCINRGSGNSEQLLKTTREIHEWAAAADIHVLARWAPGTALIREGADGLSRADVFEPRDRTVWRVPAAVAAHWNLVHGDELKMPQFSRVGPALASAIAAYAESGITASFMVPEWPSASWYPMLKRFRLEATYGVGSKVITHEGLGGAVPSRHPMVVLRLAGPLETGLSKAQQRAAQRCLGQTWKSQTMGGPTLDSQALLRRAGRVRSSAAVA